MFQMGLYEIDPLGQGFPSVHKHMVLTVYTTDSALQFQACRFQKVVMDLDPFFSGLVFKGREFALKTG